ncbi:hypothetical protein [Halostagnicola sp. A56]|uniref:hypothetical protein n=1 Tax=Halostagnicola sp. A56 TaxID=1495067 RepID=UPI0012E2C177|nr:hypothetical protein [Halostagnicola sp. A56]
MVDFEPRLFEELDPAKRPSLAAALIPIAGMIGWQIVSKDHTETAESLCDRRK